MATPIREACLDEHNEPNEVAARVQEALDVKGCLCINRPGGRCKAKVTFDAVGGWITCAENPRHRRESYDKPFGKVVFEAIRIADIEGRGHRAVDAESEAKLLDLADKRASRERGKRKAESEAKLLDLEPGEVHDRPDGAAPPGQTWSYRLGDWVPEDHFKRCKATE